jgi:hypothetical protein
LRREAKKAFEMLNTK